MNKADLVRSVAEKAGITKKAASGAVGAIVAAVSDALAAGDTVSIHGFGRFSVRERAARKAQHVRTGRVITVPARKVPVFRAAAGLKAAVR